MPSGKKPKSAHEVIIAALRRGNSNAEALAKLQRAHPRTTLGLATINYYRTQLRRRKGSKIPSDREARRRA